MSGSGSREQLTIRDGMILIAGIAFGLWLFHDELKFERLLSEPDGDAWLATASAVFGGVTLAATPLIVFDRLRGGRRWRSGALNWLALGLGCWSFAPALVIVRLNLAKDPQIA